MPLCKAQLDLLGSSGFCFSQNIGVDVCGDVHITVTKMLGHNFQVDTVVQEHCCVAVTELMQCHILELRSFGKAFEGLIHRIAVTVIPSCGHEHHFRVSEIITEGEFQLFDVVLLSEKDFFQLLPHTDDADTALGLRIVMNTSSFQPYRYTAITVCLLSFSLTFTNELGKLQILCRLIHAINKAVITAARYFKESAHLTDAVFVFVSIYDTILDLQSHFLSVSERKSRISSFSIQEP